MSFPWKKFSYGWGYDENPKVTRKRIKQHTDKVINQEIFGEETDKRLGKGFNKRKGKIEKPFKIYCKDPDHFKSIWRELRDWYVYSEFAKKEDRDHEFEKLKRSYFGMHYEWKTEDEI